MHKLIYLVATTADGFIATASGGFEVFVNEGEHVPELLADFPETIPEHVRGFVGLKGAANRSLDTVLMGRATYEIGLRDGVTNPYPHLKQYVFSNSLGRSPDPAVQVVSGDPLGLVRELKQRSGLGIWLCGGGNLAAQLFPEIDELILKVNPVVIGRGIPLFGGPVAPSRMRLLEHRVYANGYARMRYALR